MLHSQFTINLAFPIFGFWLYRHSTISVTTNTSQETTTTTTTKTTTRTIQQNKFTNPSNQFCYKDWTTSRWTRVVEEEEKRLPKQAREFSYQMANVFLKSPKENSFILTIVPIVLYTFFVHFSSAFIIEYSLPILKF